MGCLKDWTRYIREPLDPDVTVDGLLDYWIQELNRKQSPSIKGVQSAIHHQILPAFRGMKARELLPVHIEAWVIALRQEKLADKTVLKVVRFLARALNLGTSLGVLQVNPVSLLPAGTLPPNRPRDPHRAMAEVLTPDEILALVNERRIPIDRRILWATLLFTGARLGEASGLLWKDYAPTQNRLTIERSWNCRLRRLGPLKNNITRYVPVSRHLKRLLVDAQQWAARELGMVPGAQALILPVFRQGVPGFWHQSTALRLWREDLALVGVEEPPSGPHRLHATRHTFISLIRRAGVDAAVAHQITHGSKFGMSTSERIYTHFDWAALVRAIEVLDAFIDAN